MSATPGPWRIHVVAEGKCATHIFGPDGRVGKADSGPESIANARLIAAAPELLDALRECAERLGTCALFGGSAKYAVEAMLAPYLALVAKAEGKC